MSNLVGMISRYFMLYKSKGLGYVIIYLAKSKVPWQQIYTNTKEEKYEQIKEIKMKLSAEKLCEGLPP